MLSIHVPARIKGSKAVNSILEVKNLQTHFYTRTGIVKAVNNVSFSLGRGETLGIVGESGSGKSVTMLSIMGLLPSPPAKVVSGEIVFDGRNLRAISKKEFREIRGNRISMVFQDPMTSLNPYLKVGVQLAEVLVTHCGYSKKSAMISAGDALERVGISDAGHRLSQYPHQFSGGMRQRIMIAMALLTKPDLLIADEPTTALDVTVQAQILELLDELKKELGMAMILITHDLGIVARMANKIQIMYAGNIVEHGGCLEIFESPQHPYTCGLLESLPTRKGIEVGGLLKSIPGTTPDLTKLPIGCPFAPRCEKRKAVCTTENEIPWFSAVNQQAQCHNIAGIGGFQ